MNQHDSLLPKHGGYKHLLSYQLAELIFDITVLFCEKYVSTSDRTNDQMVQSARSGFQNIAEGSVDSGVSKKSEIKLTGIAIGCLDELAKDYRKYLQKKNLEEWSFQHPALVDLKQRQVKTLLAFREWVKDTRAVSGKPIPPDQAAANGILSLLNLALYLTRKQLAALEKRFLEDGGISERMHRLRQEIRGNTGKTGNTDTRTDTDRHGRGKHGGTDRHGPTPINMKKTGNTDTRTDTDLHGQTRTGETRGNGQTQTDTDQHEENRKHGPI